MFFNSAGERDLGGDYTGQNQADEASRSIISGKLSLGLSWCPEVGEAEKQLAGSLNSSSRLSTEHEAQGFCAVFLETRLEPTHRCSVEGCLHARVSLSTLQFLGSGSEL